MLILDTETTGLDSQAEIIEIAIINESGNVVFESLVKPTKPIPEDAIAIHGIANEQVHAAPLWFEIATAVNNILSGKEVAIYNAAYDVRLIEQTCGLYHLTPPRYFAHCVMLPYAEYWGEISHRGSYKWQSLTNAARQQHIDISDLDPHRAKSDCEITRRIMNKMGWINSI
ncbi:3'-5' exonuclease [Shewanella sp. 202IG2-18]|uniref:3'-5' exonuclease n=1 Tax=Parashewanella hymeniacidonis TaxID=2807618 RepID=UPI001960D5B2|nr:3'-5' exonuclease [Parashewanella hymeniacidonis]MBM7074384.1 3'-5' exonuclease [Parashewanella hymeniacidonis]